MCKRVVEQADLRIIHQRTPAIALSAHKSVSISILIRRGRKRSECIISLDISGEESIYGAIVQGNPGNPICH